MADRMDQIRAKFVEAILNGRDGVEAVLSAAREIDSCETCEHSGGCAIEQGVIDAKKRGWYSDWKFCCNRHKPKEE